MEVDDTEEITTTTKLEDIDEWDSIGVLTIISEVDDNFDITLDPEALEELETVEQLLSLFLILINMSTKLEDKVRGIIISVLNISEDQYSDDLAIGDIPEWDSVNHVLLIQQIEEDFDINLDVTDAIDIEDVFDILATLKQYNID